ncbi:MAG TPA: porin family protein [Chitinophagaceae bacterium]|nr:porin family protein [Chitinophagaceae bacterium]
MNLAKYLLPALICSTLSVQAQQDNFFNKPDKNGQEKRFYGGVVLGINAAQIDGDTYAGYHKAGLNTGLAAYIKMSNKVVASVELLYSQKGARNVQVYNSPAVGSVPIMYNAKLNYAEIPVMIHYAAAERLHLGIGASYSRLISDKELMDSYTSGITNTLENTYRKQDYNYLVAVSYQLYNNFFARARYQYSIVSIRDAQKIPVEFGTPRQFNNLFALQFVCLF